MKNRPDNADDGGKTEISVKASGRHHAEKVRESEPLSIKASLGHASLADASPVRSVEDTASGHLPKVKVSLQTNPTITEAHNSLINLAHGHLGSADAESKFAADMKTFEQRAGHDRVTAAQVAQTYNQVGRILKDAQDSPFSTAQRQELAEQWMKHLANPTGTNHQGWHDTCTWTLLENRLLTKDPEKISAKFVQAVTTGGITTLDMATLQEQQAKGDNSSGVPFKVLNLDKGSFQPDQEAQNVSKHADHRDLADQVAQVIEASISWDAKMIDPKGDQVKAGTMQYRQGPVISRPADVSADGQHHDKSGESVSYVDPVTGKRQVEDAQGQGFGGGASQNEVALVNTIITGRAEPLFMSTPDAGNLDPQTNYISNSNGELHQQLKRLKREGQFPMPVDVLIDKKGVVEDYLAAHPEKTIKNVPKNAWHAISVLDVDGKGNVQIFNPWGIRKTISEDDLYKAMRK